MVKLIVGKGGENIKHIQRKSKARIQIKKDDEELNKGFGEGGLTTEAMVKAAQAKLNMGMGAAPSNNNGEKEKMRTILLYGEESHVATAKQMINDLFDKAAVRTIDQIPFILILIL